MSFNLSAQNIRVDDGHILRASLCNEGGDWVEVEMDLNNCLGNDNGSFQWGGCGFADSAEGIYFDIEGGASVPVLRARLATIDGEWVDANVNLAERIGNDNGNFNFV